MAASGGFWMATASAQAPASQIVVSVDPSSGPTGTGGTITVSGGQPGDPVTLTIGPGSTNGVIGANGTYTSTTTFSGFPGDVITITAQVGNSSDSPSGSTTFTITAVDLEADIQAGDGSGSQTAPDAQPAVSVTVDPSSGPTGTSATVTVKGGRPGDSVTLTIGPGSTNGVIGADGTYTYTATFSGFPGDVITVEAQVGNSLDSPKGSATFTITAVDLEADTQAGDGNNQQPAPDAQPAVSVTVDPASGPSGTTATITVTGGTPGEAVTLTMGPGATGGVVGADGTYTFTTTFFGRPGDVITIEAQVGNSSDSPKGSTTFTVTGEPALGLLLHTGGNLITYGGATLPVLDALGPIAEFVESISWFDPATQSWDHWTPGQEALPDALRRHIELLPGTVYWVVVSSPVTWTFPVTVDSSSIEISAPDTATPPPVTRVTILSDGTRVYDTDENGDGVVDHRLVLRRDGSRVELRDTDGDGKFDTAVRYDANGLPLDRWTDANGDGIPQVGEMTNLPIRTHVDSNNDGKIDHVDIDIDGDGKVDVRMLLDAQGKPVRVLIFVPWDDRPVETIDLDANGRERSRFVDHNHDGIDDRLQDPLLSDEFVEFDGQDPALGLFPEDGDAATVCVTDGPHGIEILDGANASCDAPAPAPAPAPFFPGPPVEVEVVSGPVEVEVESEPLEELG